MKDFLLDSLDHTLIFMPQSGGDVFYIIFAVIPLLWAGWCLFKKRLDWQKVRLAAAVGLGAASAQALYILIRLDQVTTISKAVVFSPLSIIAAFVLTMEGVLIYLHSHSRIGKAMALFVMTFVSWLPMVMVLAMLVGFNTLFAASEIGTPLYNYSIGVLPAGSLLVSLALSVLVLWAIRRRQLIS